MIKASSATLKANETVTKIKKNARNGKWIVTTTKSSDKYDAVILATPPHHSNIVLSSKVFKIILKHPRPLSFSDIRNEITNVDYVRQHVTLFTTNATHLSSTYMKVALPMSLWVTRYLERQNSTQDLNLDVDLISVSKTVSPQKELLVKLFSPNYLDDSKLARIVDGRANVGWVYRKIWHAYPRAPPINATRFPLINPDQGFYYVNAFESFISTMETECVAAHNAIRLLLGDFGYDETTATLTDDYWIDTTY